MRIRKVEDAEEQQRNDHDLLIQIRTQLEIVIGQIGGFSGTFVTKDEFRPVKSITYGMVGLMLTSVVVAILAVVIKT